MTKRWLMGTVVACLMAFVSAPAHAIALRYAPKVGEVHKQKANMAGRMEMTMAALGQTMRGEMTVEMDYSEKVLSQTESITRVQTDLLGGKGTFSMAGQSQTIDMPTGTIVADMNRLGAMVKLVEMNMPGSEQFMGSGAETLPNWSQYSAFPEGDVKVGDTWSGKVSIPAGPNMPSIEMTYECALLDLTTFKGRNCARIRTVFSGPFTMDMADAQGVPPGTEGTVEAVMDGSIDWYYDYDNSVYVYGEGSMGMDMKVLMQGEAAAAGDVTMKLKMNIKTALQEQKAESAQ